MFVPTRDVNATPMPSPTAAAQPVATVAASAVPSPSAAHAASPVVVVAPSPVASAHSPVQSPHSDAAAADVATSLSVSPTQLQTLSPASLPPLSPNEPAKQQGSPSRLPSLMPGITKLSTHKRTSPEEADDEDMEEESCEPKAVIPRVEDEPPTSEKEIDEADDLFYPPEMRKKPFDAEVHTLRKWELKQAYDAERVGPRTTFAGQFLSQRQKKALNKKVALAREVAGHK